MIGKAFCFILFTANLVYGFSAVDLWFPAQDVDLSEQFDPMGDTEQQLRSAASISMPQSVRFENGVAKANCNRTHEFPCNNGRCIATRSVCNGRNDCGDNTDEVICSPGFRVQPSQFQWQPWSVFYPREVDASRASRSMEENTIPTYGGEWSAWSMWSLCSSTCGQGTQRRLRSCLQAVATWHGGTVPRCPGSNYEDAPCQLQACSAIVPSNVAYGRTSGAWSSWGQWSRCTASCGEGYQVRSRTCTGYFMAYCYGHTEEMSYCNMIPCPVNGNWSPWSTWSGCSVSCGTYGYQTRNRACNSPAPSGGGLSCYGYSSTYVWCSVPPCAPSGVARDPRLSEPLNGRSEVTNTTTSTSTSTTTEATSTTKATSTTSEATSTTEVTGTTKATSTSEVTTEATSSTVQASTTPPAVEDDFGSWGEWSDCVCKVEQRSRHRKCLRQKGGCRGESAEVSACEPNECQGRGSREEERIAATPATMGTVNAAEASGDTAELGSGEATVAVSVLTRPDFVQNGLIGEMAERRGSALSGQSVTSQAVAVLVGRVGRVPVLADAANELVAVWAVESGHGEATESDLFAWPGCEEMLRLCCLGCTNGGQSSVHSCIESSLPSTDLILTSCVYPTASVRAMGFDRLNPMHPTG